ncbi:hypothetical protein, partial [Phaeobacter gallaeciensis]
LTDQCSFSVQNSAHLGAYWVNDKEALTPTKCRMFSRREVTFPQLSDLTLKIGLVEGPGGRRSRCIHGYSLEMLTLKAAQLSVYAETCVLTLIKQLSNEALRRVVVPSVFFFSTQQMVNAAARLRDRSNE